MPGGLAAGDNVDVVEPDISFSFFGQCRDDVLPLRREGQKFAAVDINRRNAAGDKYEGFVLIDRDGLGRQQHFSDFFGNFTHGEYLSTCGIGWL